MKVQYHREITVQALSSHFQPSALERVVSANIGQDALRYQVTHDHFHYDNNAFAAGDQYVDEIRQSVMAALRLADAASARMSFGRLTHTVQDFYSHSNYVALWRERNPESSAQDIDPCLSELLQDSCLCSGRLYYPFEALSFITVLKPAVLPFLPRDSHAWMNLDDPSRHNFDYAFAAAVKRTEFEFNQLAASLNSNQIALFTASNHHSNNI